VVPVAIRDEDLVRGGIDIRICGLMHVHSIRVPLTFAGAADLEKKLSVGAELEYLIVIDRSQTRKGTVRAVIPTDPDVARSVDMNEVLPLRPLISSTLPAPGVDRLPVGIEDHDGRSGGTGLLVRGGSGAMKEPYIVFAIHGKAGGVSQLPFRG
jgi:hypothetical protein